MLNNQYLSNQMLVMENLIMTKQYMFGWLLQKHDEALVKINRFLCK